MSHPEQRNFCAAVKQAFPQYFHGVLALDVGSLDINGSNRDLFTHSQYIGIDLSVGRSVDIVSKGHELALPDQTFDVVLSAECFEHDQYYQKTIQNMFRMLKPGGLFFFTCATTGRPEHGTRRTSPQDAPLLANEGDWHDYYKNLEASDIEAVFGDMNAHFQKYEFLTNPNSQDLYFWGIKQGSWVRRNDYSFVLQYQKTPEYMAKQLAELSAVVQQQIGMIVELNQQIGALKHQISELPNNTKSVKSKSSK